MHRHLHLPLLQKEPGLFALLVTHVVHIQKQTHTHTQAHTCRLPRIVQASSYIVPHPLFNSIFWPKRTFHDGSGSGNGNGSGSSSRSSFPVPRYRCPFHLTVVLVVPTASGAALPLHLPLVARLFIWNAIPKFFPLLQQLKLTILPHSPIPTLCVMLHAKKCILGNGNVPSATTALHLVRVRVGARAGGPTFDVQYF